MNMIISDNVLISVGAIVMSLVIILITGFFLYVLIKNPVKSFQFMLKGVAIFTLGFVAWFGLFYLLMYI